MNRRIIIVTGGRMEDSFALGYLREFKADMLIAADSGLAFFYRNHIEPDCIVGDFDSLDPAILEYYRKQEKIEMHTFNPVKDMTDTDIAMKRALEENPSEICFLGATGTRLDHTISNIYNLFQLYEKGIVGRVVDAYNNISMPLEKSFCLKKKEQFGDYVSFLPFGNVVEGLSLKGFKYPLNGHTLVFGDGGLGVSNEIQDEEAFVSYEKGILIMLQTRDKM